MASFIAFLPGPSTSVSAEVLCREFTERGLPCHAEPSEHGSIIVFEASADLLYLTMTQERIDYLEHGPAHGAKPWLAGRIDDALVSIGFDFIEENDPRSRAG